VIDTLALAREMFPGKRNSLDALCERFDVDNAHRSVHGALLDAQLLAEVYLTMTAARKRSRSTWPRPRPRSTLRPGRHGRWPSPARQSSLSRRPPTSSPRTANIWPCWIAKTAGRCLWLALEVDVVAVAVLQPLPA
jgi:DNA polymerase-3 subunit epsilon